MSGRREMLAKEHEERRAKFVPEGEAKKTDKRPVRDVWRRRAAAALAVAAIAAAAWWLLR